MPNDIVPVPESAATPSRSATSLALRAWTRIRRNRLDRELALGADPGGSASLARRAAHLRSRRERARLANALVERLGDARRREPVTITVRPQRAAVRACADELSALVLRLRDDRPVDVHGAAMTARLVSDRSGPLRRPGDVDLRDAIRAAHVALDNPAQTAPELATAA
jgi:hypothetical protein